MTVCPNCVGVCDANEIQLNQISIDTGDYFHCITCGDYFLVERIDEEFDADLIEELKDAKKGRSEQ